MNNHAATATPPHPEYLAAREQVEVDAMAPDPALEAKRGLGRELLAVMMAPMPSWAVTGC